MKISSQNEIEIMKTFTLNIFLKFNLAYKLREPCKLINELYVKTKKPFIKTRMH